MPCSTGDIKVNPVTALTHPCLRGGERLYTLLRPPACQAAKELDSQSSSTPCESGSFVTLRGRFSCRYTMSDLS